MNQYMILACSDYYGKVFDIYIDTVEAACSNQAIEKFAKDNFPFKEKAQFAVQSSAPQQHILKQSPL